MSSEAPLCVSRLLKGKLRISRERSPPGTGLTRGQTPYLMNLSCGVRWKYFLISLRSHILSVGVSRKSHKTFQTDEKVRQESTVDYLVQGAQSGFSRGRPPLRRH